MTKKEDKELQRHVRWVQNSSFEAGMAEYGSRSDQRLDRIEKKCDRAKQTLLDHIANNYTFNGEGND